MTNEQAQKLEGRSFTIVESIKLAFDAGGAHCIGSSREFKQIHLDQQQVLEILIPRIIK